MTECSAVGDSARDVPAIRSAEPRLFLAAVAACVLPVWLAHYPPLVDLPQHAAQVRTLADLGRPDYPFRELFRVNWFTPYLFGYVLVFALAKLTGIAAASKAVLSAALLAVPLLTRRLARELGGDPFWAWLVFPGLLSFAYHWGFLNYVVATPLGIGFLWLVCRFVKAPTVSRGIAVGVALQLLFFCHALVCVFFGGIAGLLVLAEVRGWGRKLLALLPLAALVPTGALWGFLTLGREREVQQTLLRWELIPTRVAGVPMLVVGKWANKFWNMDSSPAWALLTAALLALPFLAGARLARSPLRWLPFASVALLVSLGPSAAFGIELVSQRFAAFVLPLFVLALDPPGDGPEESASRRKAARAAVVLAAVGGIAASSVQAARFDAEQKGFGRLLSEMKPYRRVLSLVTTSRSVGSPAPVYLHFAAWYTAEKGGLVDPSFSVYHAPMVRYRSGMEPPSGRGAERRPDLFDWTEKRGRDYDYFVVRADEDLSARFFSGADCPVRLVVSEPPWWLYGKDEGCAPLPR